MRVRYSASPKSAQQKTIPKEQKRAKTRYRRRHDGQRVMRAGCSRRHVRCDMRGALMLPPRRAAAFASNFARGTRSGAGAHSGGKREQRHLMRAAARAIRRRRKARWRRRFVLNATQPRRKPPRAAALPMAAIEGDFVMF